MISSSVSNILNIKCIIAKSCTIKRMPRFEVNNDDNNNTNLKKSNLNLKYRI